MKVAGLSALHTSRLNSPGDTPVVHFFWRLSAPQGHSVIKSIKSMKKPNYPIGN